MSESIVVLDPIGPEALARLSALLPPGFSITSGRRHGEDHLKEIIAEADYAIAGQVAVSGEVLRAARKLKLLQKWGVGIDNLDVAAAREMGIRVARTTGSNQVPVAEFALGLMLGLLRGIVSGNSGLKGGVWRGVGARTSPTYTLSGKVVGIVGFGAIGQQLARLLRGFGCTILYAKRRPLGEAEEIELGARYASLSEILAQADVISLNCPLTEETAGLIDRKALAAMKPNAVLVNVARGGIVVEHDLIEALRANVILGAALDVYETEPLPPDSPLLAPLDNLVLTPHLAAMAIDNFEPTVRRMFGNILSVSRGEPLPERDVVV